MKINLKNFVDEKNVTIEKMAIETGISISVLTLMYTEGIFDAKKVGVDGLAELMAYFDITNVQDLVPEIS